jgi:6,7-dimethyl-8-ribityllumazine synthase
MQRAEFTRKTKPKDASQLRIAIVAARFNTDITDSMIEGALAALKEWGVNASNTHVARVYGSFDLVFGCMKMIKQWKPDAVVALGCIIKGETDHDRYIASAVSQGLIDLTLSSGVPISFGVITANTLAQAKARSRGKTNHGEKAAVAALEMALL